jgi:hypothetical protein
LLLPAYKPWFLGEKGEVDNFVRTRPQHRLFGRLLRTFQHDYFELEPEIKKKSTDIVDLDEEEGNQTEEKRGIEQE